MKRLRYLTPVFTVAATLFLAGCAFSIRDLTPSEIPANPSDIYTLEVLAKPLGGNIDRDSIQTEVVIDGRTQSMSQDPEDPSIYRYDYRMPPGRTAAKFYYVVNYKLVGATESDAFRKRTSDLEEFQLTNRYMVELESYRGPVGAVIPVLGRGFTRGDTVVIGNVEAETEFVNQNLMRFTVPNLPAGKSYPIIWRSGFGDNQEGYFRVDGPQGPGTGGGMIGAPAGGGTGDGMLTVNPASISVTSGETVLVGFQTAQEAPPGGYEIDVTTDIPDSVIMPLVRIPAGQRTVSVQLQGGLPAEGSLFVTMPGLQGEIVVPVTVEPRRN